MQHRLKWLLAPAVVLGIALLMGSVQCLSGGKAGSNLPLDFSLVRAEAATAARHVAAARDRYYNWRWTRPVSKIVPILSVGTPGLRLGLAQVSGPKGPIDHVKAVLQLDAEYKGVRAKVMVPSDSFTSLHRVDGTAVSAVVQYQLVDFQAHHKTPPPRPTVHTRGGSDDRGHVWHGEGKGHRHHGEKRHEHDDEGD